MRSTLFGKVVGVSLAFVVLGASSSMAASKPKPKPPAPPVPVTITDPAGDANGVNDQGAGAPVPSVSTPVDVSGADILSITWTSLVTVKKVGNSLVNVPTGMTVKMVLSGAPQLNTIYRVTTATADCTTFWLNYSSLVGGSPSASLQHNCPGFTASSATSATESDKLTTVVVDGSSITWTVPAALLPKAIKMGTQITSLSGHTRFYAGTSVTGGATVPVLDEAAGSATYTYGK